MVAGWLPAAKTQATGGALVGKCAHGAPGMGTALGPHARGIMASGLLAISVLIPTHNRADIIRCTRESLREAKTLAGTAVKM